MKAQAEFKLALSLKVGKVERKLEDDEYKQHQI